MSGTLTATGLTAVPDQDRQLGKIRRPALVWLFGVLTLSIYSWFWYYRINREIRDYAPAIEVNPLWAAVSISWLGWLLIGIPPLVSWWHTGGRIGQVQEVARQGRTVSPLVGLLLLFLFNLGPVYYQIELNRVWALQQMAAP